MVSDFHRRSIEPERYSANVEMKSASSGLRELSSKEGDHDQKLPAYSESVGEWGDSPQDVRDMQRLGKKQELKSKSPLVLLGPGLD